jgi:glutamate-ammonia-ligase adenylyltransferase
LVLENFAKIIRSVPLPKIWYEEFQNKKFFDFFLRMCEYSQKAVNKFFEEAFIKDDFLSRTCFDEFKSENLSQMSLPQIHFRICIQLLNKDITAIDAASIISEYHLLKIKQLVENEKLNETFKENYFIAGMGSFASSDMNFSSDVDLIFVVKDLSSHSNAQKIFQNLLNKLKTSVKGTEFDCRLRPEGKSSYLVWDFDQYKKYFYQRARVWELQAMTKCRFIEGNKKLFNNFLHSFIERVKVTDTLQIKNEMKQMRLKLITSDETGFHIKKSPGGLLDIDFIISFLILKKISDNYSFAGKSTSEKFKLIDNTDLKKSLLQNYNFLKSVEFYVQSITDSRTSRIPIDSKQLKKLSLQSGFESEREFNNAFNNIVKMNLELFKETFEKSD